MIAIFAPFLLAALVQNQAPVPMPPAPQNIPAIAGIDRTFAQAAMQGNNAELDMAQLALHRASIPEVKNFAQKMIDEHTGLQTEMMPALSAVLPAPPAERLNAADSVAYAHLQTISDVDFDQIYITQQIGDHLATLTAFQTEADSGTNPQLKMLARKWLPSIQAHLQLAVSMNQHIGGSSPLRSH